MKITIARLSSHQNAKVVAVLMAISSLFFVIPMFIAFALLAPGVDAQGREISGPPALAILFLPLLYLAMGYVMVRLACWLYNFMFQYLGGLEYETRDNEA